jgi:phage shock protein B
MPEEVFFISLMSIMVLFLGLPWMIFHYVTIWKSKSNTLSAEAETLLDELYELGRRLDDRVATIERIMTAENPGWRHLTADPASVGLDSPVYSERNKVQ